MVSARARKVINSIKPNLTPAPPGPTEKGSAGYDNVRDDIEKVKKIREGSVEKVPSNDSDIANKKYVDDQNLWEVDGTTVQLKAVSAIDMQFKRVRRLSAPINSDDSARKGYVDDLTTNHPHQDVNTTASPSFTGLSLPANNDKITLGTNSIELYSDGTRLFLGENGEENMYMDFDTTSNWIEWGSTSGATDILSKFNFNFNNETELRLGNSADCVLTYTTVGNNNMQCAVGTVDDGEVGTFSLMRKGQEKTANKSPTQTYTDPRWRAYSSDNTQAEDWIQFGHDQTDGVFEVGNGNLKIMDKIKLTKLGGYAVLLTNKTGSNSVAGQLVKPDTATDDAFVTIAANDQEIIGIVLESGVTDGSEAWVVVSGIANVLMDAGGSARGDRIISSATAGSGDVWNVGGAVATHFQEIGHCIETRTGAGLARCVLHFN